MSLNCTFELDGQSFQSEELLDEYIKLNKDLKNVGDYRYSKDKAAEYQKIIKDMKEAAEERLKKARVNTSYTKSTKLDDYSVEEDETYNDGFVSALSIAEGTTRDSERYSEENYFSKLKEDLEKSETLLKDFPNKEEREKEIARILEEKKQSIEDIRAAGKGLHNFLENLLSFRHPLGNKRREFIRERRNYIKQRYEKASLDKISDKTLNSLIDQVERVKKSIRNGRVPLHTFIEPVVEYDNENGPKFRGKIDAVVVYEDGSVDVFDFKISETAWEAADRNKRDIAENQLHLYKIALENMGIKSSDINIYVFPVMLKREKGMYVEAEVQKASIVPISYKPEFRAQLIRQLNLKPENQPIDSEVGKTTISALGKMFGFDTITHQKENLNFQLAWDLLVKKVGNTYSFTSPISGRHFSGSEEQIRNDLYIELQVSEQAKQEYATEIKNKINGIDKKSTAQLNFIYSAENNRLTKDFLLKRNNWLNRQFFKYKTQPGWRIVDNPDLLQMGVLMIQNDITREVDFVSLTYDNILAEVNLKYGKTLLGNHKQDRDVPFNKRMRPSLGNMELIKLMTIANQLDSDYTIGELKVLSLNNQFTSFSSTEVRDSLVYNYNVLANLNDIPANKIEFTDLQAQILEEGRLLAELKNAGSSKLTETDAQNIHNKVELLRDDNITRSERLARMTDLYEFMSERFYNGSLEPTTDDSLLGRFYNDLGQAITVLTHTTIDYSNATRLRSSLTGGGLLEGLKNDTLFNSTSFNTQDTIPIARQIYIMFEDAGLKLKNQYYTYKTLDRQHTDKFKNSANRLSTNNIVNRYEIAYRNLFNTSENGRKNFLLKDYRTDTSLNKDERAYLKWWLEELNKRRFNCKDKAELDNKLAELEAKGRVDEWFAVPLLRAGMISQVVNNKKNLIEAVKDQAGFDPELTPKMALGTVFTKTDFAHNQLLFDKMYNIFQVSEDPDIRNKMLQEMGVGTFETNLERIKDMYVFSDLRQKIYNPLLTRASAALNTYAFNATMSNVMDDNRDSIEYLVKYIKSSILDESLIKEDYQDAVRVLNVVKSTASRMVLGFNILTTFKEGTVGFWTLFNNANANRFDDSRFGVNDAIKAYKAVWKDSMHQIDTITLGEHLNFQYGMSNMSVQEMVERMNYFQGQVGRVDDRLFWCTRVCDYLHRMTIFYAYMNKYDCLKAHKVIDGHVEYDWKQDGRFSIYAKYDNEEDVPANLKDTWREQRSLFEAMRNQMVEDGVEYVSDWNTGEMKKLKYTDKFLPRAFTNHEARKMIQESNTMYGYMDNANKSLYFREGIGVIIGQFQTFISAKKNQYFLKPDVYQNGRWVYLKDEQGRQLYRTYDANGEPQITLEDNGNPIKIWEGSMMGGIFWSLKSLLVSPIFNKDMSYWAGMKAAWADPNNKRNIALLSGDIAGALFLTLICWMLYGGMKNSDLSYWDRNIKKVLDSASSEFNILSIFTGQLEFRFTSYEILKGFYMDLYSSLTGDMNIFQALASNLGVLRPYREMIYDAVKE